MELPTLLCPGGLIPRMLLRAPIGEVEQFELRGEPAFAQHWAWGSEYYFSKIRQRRRPEIEAVSNRMRS